MSDRWDSVAECGIVAAVAICVSVLTGCARGLSTYVDPGEEPMSIETVAVYSFGANPGFDLETSYAETVEMVGAVLETDRFKVYSYGDFQMFRTDGMAAYEGPSLLAVIRREGLAPDTLGILEGRVVLMEDNVHRDEEDLQDAEAPRTAGVLVKASVELHHYSARRLVARAESEFRIEPLDATQFDPYPELTRQVHRLVSKVLDLTLDRVAAPPPRRALPMLVYSDHSLYFKLSEEGSGSTARQLPAMDEIDRSTTLLRGYQRIYPEITMLQVQRLIATPGLLVVDLEEDLGDSQLRPGDIITGVNGTQVLFDHQLYRELSGIEAGQSLELTVSRAGQEQQVVFSLSD